MNNPYEPPSSEPVEPQVRPLIDTQGVNLNPRDNLWQAAGIAFGLLAGILLGSLIAFGWRGAAVGGFVGVLVALIITGALLMPARRR